MSFAEFRDSVATAATPPADLSGARLALWRDGRGDWEAAHAAAQADDGPAGAWVHAYLHRKEGDQGNAAYWYRRAGRPMPPATLTLEAEWDGIARELFNDGSRDR